MNDMNVVIRKLYIRSALSVLVWAGVLMGGVAQAQEVIFVSPTNSDDYQVVGDIAYQTAYYGTLDGFPHTFLVPGAAGQELQVQIYELANNTSRELMTGIIVSQERRGVAEVARLWPSSATWESRRARETGDTYLTGPQQTVTLEDKRYLVEISNADNVGKYVVVIGNESQPIAEGYFARLATVYQVKRFFGKPWWSVLQSPYYYVPFSGAVILMLVWWYWRRRNNFSSYD
jgi:hypothetical protein